MAVVLTWAWLAWAWWAWTWLAWARVGVVKGDAIPGELYSSLAHMDELFMFDQLVGNMLPLLSEHIPEASRYLESYWSVAADREKVGGQVTSVEVTGNPLHVYSVIKRLALYWPALSHTLQAYHNQGGACEDRHSECHNWARRGHCLLTRPYMILNCRSSCGTCPSPEVSERVTQVLATVAKVVLPSPDDLRGAAYALARLQRIYLIPIGSFMQGRLDNTSCSVKLTADDCVRIANATRYYQQLDDAWLWYSYCRTASSDDPRLQAHVQALLDDTVRQHDGEWQENDQRFFPLPLAQSSHQVPWDTPYSQVCRGQRPAAQDGRVRCHVSSRGAPYLVLQPVRYEQVHHHPHIYLFYDVLSHHEISLVKQHAFPKLERSTVVSRDSQYTEGRVSHTAWLYNGTHPALLNVARRISYITGLHVFEGPSLHMAGEALQVLCYGVGGHYVAHMDVFHKKFPEERWSECPTYPNELQAGDRIATWMFYLTDVKSGGRTAFVNARASVAPVKGAAAFWYNLKANGDADFLTEHGGCPVLMGHKWVANKWIREHANFLRRPCSVNTEE